MLELDATLLIIFAIVWILLLVLKKVFFKPMEKVRRERNELIEENKAAFTRAQENHERTLSEIEARIKEARSQAQAVRDQLEEDALKERERLVKAVSDESREQVEKAKAELEGRMDGLLKELESKSEDMAKSIEQKLLHR